MISHPIYHFTRVEHLPTILHHGLLSDTRARPHLQVEIGDRGIKAQRARRLVPIPPGGVVADYVPFYYAPRSPMMSSIHHGNVPSYTDGCDRLIYLTTSLERLWDAGLTPLGTNRHPLRDFVTFSDDPETLLDLVDWPLMSSTYWFNTPDDPDRRDRRQAECLVHDKVPWVFIDTVFVKSRPVADEVLSALATIGDSSTIVFVRPSMYF